ncbi:MAG: EAL domain-containing protein [Chroococcidiopsidaceae cyanobacterium CP_BM_ER_R8_30]|nr:EAL domain-containing protein [Chroococcidiopsidaceae cyanobacterium CP_BM_ER_R8_30]
MDQIPHITTLTASYDLRLVVISLLIAIIGSYTALDMAGQVAVALGAARHLWLTGGALALGITIWAMHFIALLAYHLPIPITYVFSTVLISMVVAAVGSAVGFFLVTRQPIGWLLLLSGGIFFGLGIIGMHFTGMTAMLLQAVPVYDFKLVLLSELCAVTLSLSAVWLVFHPSAKAIASKSLRRIGGAILAGTAIDGMHYVAMAAVNFQPAFKLLPDSGIDNYVLAITIGTATLIVLLLASLASFFGQRLSAEIARAKALRESEERYQKLYDLAPDAYFSIAADCTIKFANQFSADYLGYRKEELIGKSALITIYEVDRETFQQRVARTFNEKLTNTEWELRKVRKDDSVMWVRERSQLLFDEDGTPIELQMICRDVTESKQAEEALVRSAFYDTLTGLPNRALFMDRLKQAVEQAKRRENYLFAVLFLDLDRFKVINDSLGHLLGDQLLITIAARFKACLRPTDTVARLGGDEFTILLEAIEDVSDAIRVANRVQEQLTLPFALDGQEVFTSASIGIALSITTYTQAEDVLRDADIAMYRAKNQGSARYEIFNPDMHTRAVALLQLETDLRLALERQEFRLQYQPIVSLSTGKIIGFEALVRWQHPQGLILPNDFIPVAEETGLILRICQWIISTACRQMRQWQLQLSTTPLLTISLNLSAKQFTQLDLIDQINQTLQETGLDASSLRLELTEGAIVDGTAPADTTLSQLRELGVQLSIDDFGTGYSSLGRLYRFPINGLKIDQSFVSQIGTDEVSTEIVEAIVTLAHKLGVDVTAEGVETAEQLAQLRALECEYGQGYFFSRPLDSGAAEALIMTNPQW